MLADLGHELRSPLHGSSGIIAELLRTETDAARRDRLALADRTLQHALRLADDALELARLEADAASPTFTDVALDELIEDVALTAAALRRPGVTLAVDLRPGMPLTWRCDRAWLQQILTNLVRNALDHTHAGAVVIAADVDDRAQLALAVRDTGDGIAAADRARIFEPFFQGTASTGRAGLGLPITARLVRQLGGTVELDSRAGAGSTFRVRLPMEPCPHEGAQIDLQGSDVAVLALHPSERGALAGWLGWYRARVTLHDHPDALREHLRRGPAPCAVVATSEAATSAVRQEVEDSPGTRLIEIGLGPGAVGIGPSRLASALLAAPPSPVGARVLVVDDLEIVRTTLALHLRELGCLVETAEDGRAAVACAAADAAPFDIVLLDHHMPGMDGLATARALHGQPRTRTSRRVVLVNAGDEAVSSGWCRAGAVEAVLVRAGGDEALRSRLARTVAAALSSGAPPQPTSPAPCPVPIVGDDDDADTELAQMLEETLEEDLLALLDASTRGDDAAVAWHLHRMEGALAVRPHADHRRHLTALMAASREQNPALVRETAEQFLSAVIGHAVAS